MNSPWLIQRCEVADDKLHYDCMGSSEFEWGACPTSLKRLFAAGIAKSTTRVVVESKVVEVYMLVPIGFDVETYTRHLQQMAENTLQLKERTQFDDSIRQRLGLPLGQWRSIPRTNAWFDIENDVLWTLDKEVRTALLKRLNEIETLWAKK